MNTLPRIARRALVAVLFVSLAFGQAAPLALAQAGSAGNVVLRGKVMLTDSGQAVSSARVYAVHLDTKQVFTSAPSSADGDYQITGLPFGYYDLAVETADGLYLANRVVTAPAGERIEISLVLGPPQPEDTEWWSAEPDRRIPGLDRIPDGVARIFEGEPRPADLARTPGASAAATSVALPGATTAAGAAGLTAGAAGWLIPAIAAAGIIGGGILLTDDNDDNEDAAGSPFE